MAGLLQQGAAAQQPATAPANPVTPQFAAAAAQAGAPGPQPPQQDPAAGGAQQAPVSEVQQIMPDAKAVPGTPVGPEEQASPEEQQEYQRAMQALSKVLYANDKTANSVVNQIDPNDKVGSTAKANMLIIQQLDKQINMDESIIAQMTQEVSERVMELAETRHGFEYSEREAQVILGATWEGVMQIFGVDETDVQGLAQEIGPDNMANLKQQHEGFLNG